jgi:hypothetical protein
MHFFTGFRNIITAFVFAIAAILLAISPEKAAAQGKAKVVQLTGIVTAGDSLYGLIGASVHVPKAGRGTTTNQYGYFSLAVLAGDSVVFSSVGFKTQYIKIPRTFRGDSYSVIIEMREDLTALPEVRIFPYSTEELFKRAFLSLKLPDEDQKAVAKNLNEAIIERMMLDAPASPTINFRERIRLQDANIERRYMAPTIPLTAWKELIDAIKRGDLKNQKTNE